jgi:dTDP-4-dehydrorhamnose 3,5-epimerase
MFKMQKLIHGIEIKKLEKHIDERGFLCEILRKDWNIFEDFSMTYFSLTYPNVVRAWHRHPKTKQKDNMCIIQGTAKIVIYDDRQDSPTKGIINEFIIGEDNMILLKIPGECWHGFKALGTKPAILINFPNKLYDYESPDEERLLPDTDKIPYDWKLAPWLKHG